jgi:tetratricopeptide (TPR) repeat protein
MSTAWARLFKSNKGKRFLLLLVLALTLIYARTLTYPFVYDDGAQIVANARIQSWHYVPGYFTQRLWAQRYTANQSSYYRPFFLVWLRLNYWLLGAWPAGWHLMSLLLQMAATILLFRLSLRVSGNDSIALIAAAVFALHPLAVETTAWVSDADDSLCLIFLLGSLLLFASGRSGRRRDLIASLSLFALALLTKESAAVFPVVVFSYVLLFETTSIRDRVVQAFRIAWPYATLSVLFLLQWRRVLAGDEPVRAQVGISSFLLTVPSELWLYLRNVLVPIRLSLFYSNDYVRGASWIGFWVPLLGISMLVALLLWIAKREHLQPIAFGFVWITVMLLPPLIASIGFGNQGLVHDRYFYPALPGFGLILAQCFDHYLNGRKLVAAAFSYLLLLAVLAFYQQQFWKSNYALFYHAVAIAPDVVTPRILLSQEYMRQGSYADAEAMLTRVMEMDPELSIAHVLRSENRLQMGDTPGAEADAVRAVDLRPDLPDNRANLGRLYLQEGRPQQAATEFRQALEKLPDDPALHLQLASAYMSMKNFKLAIEQYEIALVLRPEDVQLRNFIERLKHQAASVKTD